jgi:integrase
MVEAVVHEMSRQGKAPATQVRVLALLRTVFNWAIRHGLCRDNPTKRIDWPSVDNVRMRVLSAEEVERFLAALDEWPDRTNALLMRFLLFTGLRRGQTIRMEWGWIDWDRGVVSFPSGSTKSARVQTVPLSAEALEILRQARGNRKRAGVVSSLVFPSSVGTLNKEVTKVFQQVAKRAGIEGARLHDLRRSFGSWAVSNGVDLYTVSKLLGHSSTAITQKIYAHLDIEALRKGADIVGKVLGG